MSSVRMGTRTDPADPFAIVLRAADGAEPVVLQSAPDADRATVAFYTEQRRLTKRQVVGDLLLVRQADGWTLLHEPLRQSLRAAPG